jgi:uridylate kinase
MTKPVYRRVVVKVSGEALMGPESFGIHQPTLERIAADLVATHALGVAIGLVVGGGNIFRGVKVSEQGIPREPGRMVLLAAGTGNPFFTTDTTAVLRAAEIGAEAVLKATDVDGVYSTDPKKDKNAKRYERLTHQEAIERNLKVMDATAFALARENRMPIIVFSIHEKEAIATVLLGKGRSTVVGD